MATLNEVMSRPELSGFSTAQECLDYLNTTTEQPGDSTAYTWSGIGQKLVKAFVADPEDPAGCDPDNWIAFNKDLGTIDGGPALYNCLNSGGFDFSDPVNRYQIQRMEVKEPPWAVAVLDAMLAVGAPVQVANWQRLGLVGQPELSSIQRFLETTKIENITTDLKGLWANGELADLNAAKERMNTLFDIAIAELGV